MSARDRLADALRNPELVGYDEEGAAELIDTFAHELAEQLRAWGEDGGKRLAVDEQDLPLHRSPFFMYEDADVAAGLIDPFTSERPVGGEEETP
ncbi:hypothetical protein [Streptomyces sp. NPDC085596]|uniref:hypothetical protein n=1 Tax=Streptomyces sp. NPDC085596 TaxID=3365731 RepID=UPI0037D0F979